MSDFCRPQLSTFSGTGSPLEVEQWVVDMKNLLKATRIPDESHVYVVQIQLMDIAHTRWYAKEKRHVEPMTQEKFIEAFYDCFFHRPARCEMERQFLVLQQRDKIVDEYAVEFIRLRKFVPMLVEIEEDKAFCFQQGLSYDIQELLVSQVFGLYS